VSDGDRTHRWEEELPAYALGALESDQSRALEDHLADCERCRERLRWLQPAVDVLPASVEQHAPPRALRRRVLATVREEARAERQERRSWWRGERITLSVRPALALGAAALLVAGAIGYGLSASGDGEREPVEAVVERSQGEALLRVSALPEPEGEDVYQAWFRVGNRMRPSVTFSPASDGSAVAELGPPPRRAEEVLVTQEPPGGSEEPSGAPIVAEPLS
jgi:anti-sigma-K factor RskA